MLFELLLSDWGLFNHLPHCATKYCVSTQECLWIKPLLTKNINQMENINVAKQKKRVLRNAGLTLMLQTAQYSQLQLIKCKKYRVFVFFV
jgi:hypothetical protein